MVWLIKRIISYIHINEKEGNLAPVKPLIDSFCEHFMRTREYVISCFKSFVFVGDLIKSLDLDF